MISVLIWVDHDAGIGPVSRSLAALVPLAVDGLVRDVAVLASASDQNLESLCDEAGAEIYLNSDVQAALSAARSDMVLMLRAGVFARPALVDEMARFVSMPGRESALLCEWQKHWIRRVLTPKFGGIIARRAVLKGADAVDLRQMMRAVRPAAKLAGFLEAV